MKEVLSSFSNLRSVVFYFIWPEDQWDEYVPEDTDAILAHAKIWGAACPKLTEVRVFGILVVKKEEGGWTLVDDWP